MKKAFPWILAAVLAGLLLAEHFRGKADLAKIEEDYRVEKANSEVVIGDLRKDIAARDDNINQLNGELDSNATVIAALKKQKDDAEGAVVNARKGWDAFSLEAQAKLKELDDAWSARFSLAQAEIKRWEDREKVWKKKDIEYQAKVADLEGIIAAKDLIIVACEKAKGDIARDLIRERRASRLKNWVALGAGALGYALGKA